MRARRACDRCHAVKEKCRWIPNQTSCERCHRLRFPCVSQRSVAVSGRKPRCQRVNAEQGRETCLPLSESSPSGSSPASNADTCILRTTNSDAKSVSIPETLSLFVDLNDREMQLLNDAFQGRTRIDHFVLGPSFRIPHHKTVARHLCTATPWVQDALLASCALIACESTSGPIHKDLAIGYKRAASAMSTLRSFTTLDTNDPTVFLMISIGAVTFALHISGNALPICRHSLNILKPLYESSTELNSDCLAFIISLIHSETAECLFRCEMPTLRFKVQDPSFVDRFLGLASPMLPYIYDVCKISYSLCHDGTIDCIETMKAIDAIEEAVDQWTPTLPEDFETRYLQEEIISMMAQARVYRLSVLLMTHRLRYPYGTATSKGTFLSNAILEDLDLAIQNTKRSIPYTNVAFGFACFELMDTRKRQIALDKTDVFVEFSKKLQSRIKAAITAFWSIRDKHDQLYWCEIIPLLPPSVY